MKEKLKRNQKLTPVVGVTQTNSLDVKNLKEGIMPNSTTAVPPAPPSENSEITVESMLYSNSLQTAIDKLLTPENIEMVNNGEIGSVDEMVRIPLGYIDYMTREEGIKGKLKCDSDTILNSFFNREPFLKDIPTFVSKTTYLIRWMYSVANFGRLPVSLISNPIDSLDAGIKMKDCLLAKDRGHFMTVFKMMVTENMKFDETFWKRVRAGLLKETNDGNSTPKALVDFQENKLVETISDLNGKGQVEFSLKDLIPSSYFNKIYTSEQTLDIRLETLETHKTEIQKENNGENDWTPHNFGLTELIDELIRRDWGYNQSEVDKMCSDSSLMRGECTFLSSRSGIKFSGSHSEPLMLSMCYQDSPFDYHTYESLSGDKDRSATYVNGIADKSVTTEDMRNLLNRLELVASVKDDNGYNSWLKVKDAMDNHYNEWKTHMGRKTTIFSALRPTGMDISLIYYKGLECSLEELGYRRNRKGTLELITKNFCDFVVDLIENSPSSYERRVWGTGKKGQGGAENSWKGKFNKVVKVLFDMFIKEQKNKQSKVIAPTTLRGMKLRDVRRAAASVGLPMTFQMYDNPRDNDKPKENKLKWEIVDIDLTTGLGLALCHYRSEANGGLHTEDNTFIGPAGDNNRENDVNCPKNYMSTGGDYYNRFTNDITEPGISDDNAEAFMNTLKFMRLLD